MANPPFDDSKKQQLLQGLEHSASLPTQYGLFLGLAKLFGIIFLIIFSLIFYGQIGFFVGHVFDGSIFKPWVENTLINTFHLTNQYNKW